MSLLRLALFSFVLSAALPVVGASAAGEHKISINLQNAELRQVLDYLLRGANINHAYVDEVSGKVSAQLWEVPVRQALQVILQSGGYETFTDDGVLMIRRIPKPEPPKPAVVEAPAKPAAAVPAAAAASPSGASARSASLAPGAQLPPGAAALPGGPFAGQGLGATPQVVYVPVPVPVQGQGYGAYGGYAPGGYGVSPYGGYAPGGYGVSPYYGMMNQFPPGYAWAGQPGYGYAAPPGYGGYGPTPMVFGQTIVY